MEKRIKNKASQIKIPLFIALAVILGIFIGAGAAKKENSTNITGTYMRFLEIINYIDRDYVDTVNIDDLVDYSITQMLEKLDPHTSYIAKKDVDIARSQLEGDFEGIGIEFNIIKDTIYVVAPISGGPSEAVGLQAGDKIVKVDGEIVAGKVITNYDVFKKLRGKKGTKVVVSIKRKGQAKLLDYTIIRDKIPTYSVDAYYMIDDKSGYIKVNRFAANTYNEFSAAMKELKAAGMQQLILDLKDNPGGYMDKAIRMADDFLEGNRMIVYTDGKGAKYDSEHKSTGAGEFEKGAVIVLINEGSASASEIVSGALQDNDRALIVGRRSFGKGLVQMPIPLTDGSELRLTISRYYTPSGRSIQKHYDSKHSDEYNTELLKRYEKGEYFHADSIKFDDSLKYKTTKGRVVYGGGGIMPDYFVPRDTSAYTRYLSDLFNQNVIREYTLNYYSNNKAKLSKMEFADYKKNFQITESMMTELKALAAKSGVKHNEKEYNISKEYIKNNVKAYIARSAWGAKGFYPIYNETDEIYMKSLGLFDEAKKIIGQ
ncbi:MAG: ctpA [Chitinophagaceae bacterium]|nr:ctpA [Chitinophagaceae bacterium]